jgi:3-mercaptopyruvate sulfurtransferase SseA
MLAAVVAGVVLVAAGLILLTHPRAAEVANLPYPDVPRMSPAEAYRQQQAGQAVILDARAAQLFQASHATGALSAPEADLANWIAQLPTDKTLVFYCT